jgi:hypothetical protein
MLSPIPPAKRPAPRIPRVVCRPERRANPYAVFVFVAIVAVLSAMAIVDVAGRFPL